jgi:hypothetical protein
VIGVDDGGVHAFEESSAEPLWNFPAPGASSLSNPNSLVSSGEHAFFIYGNSRRGEPIRVRAPSRASKPTSPSPASSTPPPKKSSSSRPAPASMPFARKPAPHSTPLRMATIAHPPICAPSTQ